MDSSEPHSSSRSAIPIRRGSSACSLNFPPPHRLGISSGIHPSRSSRSSISIFCQSSDALIEHATAEVVSGEDETDLFEAGLPPCKKPAKIGRGSKSRSTKPKKTKPIVKTHDETPLKEFALFLPTRLPKSILTSRSALQQFVKTTTTTHLSLWELDSKMDILELRFPVPYIEQLSEDGSFLSDFFTCVFEQISHVKSIEELYLPKIVLHRLTRLDEILNALSDTKCSIAHLFLPIKCSLQSSELDYLEYKTVASFLHAASIRELTFVSPDEIVRKFSSKLTAELKKIKKNNTKVHFSSEDLGTPGPNYIAELDQQSTVGEKIDPCSLVNSLNGTSVGPAEESEKNTLRTTIKSKARGAFSTDCTYSEGAELSPDGPFVSDIWNLDKLHGSTLDGRGTTIAVVDSGINYTHPAFKGKILAIKNFVTDDIDNIDSAIDSDGHGTHCAGLAAGCSFYCPLNPADPDSNCIMVPPGVAPGAKLVICKVVQTSNGDVDTTAFFDALDWLKEQHKSGKQKIDIVSISLASTYYSYERSQVISELTSLGVIVVCCASNVGRLRMQPIAFPARLGHVLCIGAHDENGKPTSFSPVGRELDFVAPGDSLWGPGPGTVGSFAMDCASGTSCATPAVAGLVALVLQAVTAISNSDKRKFQIGGKLLNEHIHNVWVMREILKEMSSSPGHHSDEIGYGTLNPHRFLDRSFDEIKRIINEIIQDE